jgi:hypothetical protein
MTSGSYPHDFIGLMTQFLLVVKYFIVISSFAVPGFEPSNALLRVDCFTTALLLVVLHLVTKVVLRLAKFSETCLSYLGRADTNTIISMGQHALKNVNCFNCNIYSYSETSCGRSSTLFLNVVHFFNASVN